MNAKSRRKSAAQQARTAAGADSGATICERQEIGGQAEVPSRDGAGSATVILASGEYKKELFAVKGLERGKLKKKEETAT